MSVRRPYVDDSALVEKGASSTSRYSDAIDEKKDIASGVIREHDTHAVEEIVEKFGEREDGIAPMADIQHVMTNIETTYSCTKQGFVGS